MLAAAKVSLLKPILYSAVVLQKKSPGDVWVDT